MPLRGIFFIFAAAFGRDLWGVDGLDRPAFTGFLRFEVALMWWVVSVGFADLLDLFLLVVFLGFSWCFVGMVFKAPGTGTTVLATSPYI